MEMIKIF